MRNEADAPDRLISRAELARLAGVRRPTVTTWARRHPDFPEPVRSGEGEFFRLSSAIAWLSHRPVPEKERRPGESSETTYGERVRRAAQDAAMDRSVGDAVTSGGAQTQEQTLKRLLGPLATRICGRGSRRDYVRLLLYLVFLRGSGDERWHALVARARARDVGRPDLLLKQIGDLTDQALRWLKIPPGVRGTLESLSHAAAEDLADSVVLCDGLGVGAFGTLLDRFADESGLPGTEYFTPGPVADLVADLLVSGADAGQRLVYDPHVRGGELVQAVGAKQLDGSRVNVRGNSPNPETLRLAGMNLALHGMSADLGLANAAPWEEPGGTRPHAHYVLTNPPFNARRYLPRQRSDDAWPFGPPPVHNDNYAWLQYAIESLAPGGLAGVLMPAQAGDSVDDRERQIRRRMVASGAVAAVIAFPPKLFSYTDAEVNLWLLREPTGSPGRVLFVDAVRRSDRTRAGEILAPETIKLVMEHLRGADGPPVSRPPNPYGEDVAVYASQDAFERTGYSLDPTDYMAGSLGGPRRSGYTPAVFSQGGEEERRRLGELDARVAELSPVPRTGFSGDLPEGWTRVPLAELCEIKAGPSYSRFGRAQRDVDGAVPIVMPRHLRERRIIAPDADTTTEVMAEKLAKYRLRMGDVLCVRSGATAEPALVDESQEGWLFGANLIRLRSKDPARIDTAYVLGYLSLPVVMEWMRTRSRGTVPNISTQSLGRLMVDLPPTPEQRRIGSVLRLYDEQIAAHHEFARTAAGARTDLAERLMEGALTVQ